MRIKIEQKHIDEAREIQRSDTPESYCMHKYCPISLAVKECTGSSNVMTEPVKVIVVRSFREEFTLSKKAQSFVDRFDKEEPVYPISIVLVGLE
jgi:hypothetical protein